MPNAEGSGLRSLKLKSLSLGQLNIILILMCSCQSHAAWNWGREPSNKLHVAAHRHHLSETQAEEDVLNLIDSALDASISAQNDVTQVQFGLGLQLVVSKVTSTFICLLFSYCHDRSSSHSDVNKLVNHLSFLTFPGIKLAS